MNTCEKCPFYLGENKCQLPIGGPTESCKSAREHYRLYFKTPCPRDKQVLHTIGKGAFNAGDK